MTENSLGFLWPYFEKTSLLKEDNVFKKGTSKSERGTLPEELAKNETEHPPDNRPSPFLVEHLYLLPRGRVLDIAMGGGRNAVYLACNGFEVEGIDNSAEAIKAALKLAAAHHVSITTRLVDLENNFLIEPEGYAVIMVFNYLQRNLFPPIKAGLKKNGVIVYETFTTEQPRFGPPHNPSFLLKPGELRNHFHDLQVLVYREGIRHASGKPAAKAAIIAQKT